MSSKSQTIFYGSDASEYESRLVCYANSNDEIYIAISPPEDDGAYKELPQFIAMDLPTAIRFSRVLRAEIAKIRDAQ